MFLACKMRIVTNFEADYLMVFDNLALNFDKFFRK